MRTFPRRPRTGAALRNSVIENEFALRAMFLAKSEIKLRLGDEN